MLTRAEETMTRSAALALAVLAAAVCGCGRGNPRGAAAGKPNEPVGVPVQVAAAQAGAMVEEVPVTGTVRALRAADIQAQVSGRVLAVSVREGDSVAANQVLITLSQTELQSQVEQAQAGVSAAAARLSASRRRLEIVEKGAREEERAMALSRLQQAEAVLRQAQADRERMRRLHQEGAVSRQQLDAAQTAYDTALANRDSARDALALTEKGARAEERDAARQEVRAAQAELSRAQGALAQVKELLSHTVIRSPISGVVYQRDIEPGEIASPAGPPLLRIADPGSVYLEAVVSERLASRVSAGQKVTVSLTSARTLQGSVQRLVPVADPTSRDFVVRIGLPDADSALRPGMFAQARIRVEEHPNAVIVPKDALVDRAGKTVLFVVREGKAAERTVQVGLLDRTRAEIRSGLTPGESVVVIGAQGLKDGDAVQTVPSGGA